MFARRSGASARAMVRAMSTDTTSFAFATPFKTHLCDGPGVNEAEVTKQDLIDYHATMYRIRRMEISCDTEYKARNIRGFCHLYDGQEAVAVGTQAGADKEDDVITSYRCHAMQLVRGDTVDRILAELYGFKEGSSKGKGGSMHFYSKKNHFWGGAGIVGAQVPVGVGLGLANLMRNKHQFPTKVSFSFMGDGAVNQGQVQESQNIAKLWNLPVIFCVENNKYGMGTVIDRSAANPEFYKQGGVVTPGVQVDGMDVLAVRSAVQWAREWAASGNGPMWLEFLTYRYHGHSMSDPGVTYRDREEVSDIRKNRDPIEMAKKRILDAGWMSESEIKETEKAIRNEVKESVDKAKRGSRPDEQDIYHDIYYNEVPDFIRRVERTTSFDKRAM